MKGTEEDWQKFTDILAQLLKEHVDEHGTKGICWFCNANPNTCGENCK